VMAEIVQAAIARVWKLRYRLDKTRRYTSL
jgi:hypothetical protein